jgi:hypothetical protein
MVTGSVASATVTTILFSVIVLTIYFLSRDKESSDDGFVAKVFNYGFGALFISITVIIVLASLNFLQNYLIYGVFLVSPFTLMYYYRRKGPFSLKIDLSLAVISAASAGVILAVASLLLYPFREKVNSYFKQNYF